VKTRTMFLVSAQMQSGKDAFGSALCKAVGGVTAALASPVKEAAIAMVGMPSAVAYGGQEERLAWKRYCIDPGTCPNGEHSECSDAREWLQHIGTEIGRMQIHPDLWIHRLFERVPVFSCDVVVTDARFPNEMGLGVALAFANASVGNLYKFVRVRIKRPSHVNADTHLSESAQLEIPDSVFDEVVVNDGTIGELEAKAKAVALRHRS